MKNSEYIEELQIINDNGNLFDTDLNYVIPLYQRAYAWEDEQLTQLIEDINDISDGQKYYIGSLIVSNHNGFYEVIDGQQRLTSLYLLLNCLEMDVKNTLLFACREKSNYSLKNIKAIIKDDRAKIDIDRVEPNITNGIACLSRLIDKYKLDGSFVSKLSNVVLYRIEVPPHTDLNRYFEIMNTRGEQLEQHDILKARLMNYLSNDESNNDFNNEHENELYAFSQIWDACSDMTGYVQMHFISPNNIAREAVFGKAWNEIPSNDWNCYKEHLNAHTDLSSDRVDISEIIKYDFSVSNSDGFNNKEARVRFESIIEFPYFLLHTLKVFVKQYNVKNKSDSQYKKLLDELMDDKKLLNSFSRVIENGVIDGEEISKNIAEFSRKFIVCLLRTRFLFDKYIIKREFINDSADGEWSLKSLCVSGKKSNKKPYYLNTSLKCQNEWDSTNENRVKKTIMIQSALRVSYTSPKIMHWITELLCWLSNDCTDDSIYLLQKTGEDFIKNAVKEGFFNKSEDGNYCFGVNTLHIVFNYLDYLLWEADSKKYSDFQFEFRNSVEHWYPQQPSEGTFEKWEDGVDTFGNLCIIQRNINSKFSNMSPEAKKSTFEKMIKNGSLKLRKMSEITVAQHGKTASSNWKDVICKEHEKEMIDILKKACEL